jgi:hypothetical protein
MRLIPIFFTVILFIFESDALAQGCEYDSQCKGDRICDNGRCMSPDGGDASSGGDNTDTSGSRSISGGGSALSRTCKYIGGPKAGQSEYFPPSVPITPAPVGYPCQDGRGSWGNAVPDQ